MSDGRPTWTCVAKDPYGDLWARWAPGGIRMSASSYWALPGSWDWEVVIMDGHRIGVTLHKWGATPTLPTRELAQAAAEQWVRDFAGELLRAVGPGEPSGIPGELEETP